VLRKYDVLLIADEVICGFGRTGNMWGTQTFDMQPDMVSCAKALSSGMIPISALMISERIHDAMVRQSEKFGVFSHGFTYQGHPVCSAVALETLTIYEEMDVVSQTRRVGEHMLNALYGLLEYPFVGDVSGVGLIAGVELMSNRETRVPLDATKGIPRALDYAARKNGLILRITGDRIAVAPPFIITEPEIDEMVRRLRLSLEEVFHLSS